MTTVGYGDMCPETLAGKIVGSFCSLFGLVVIAMPITSIAKYFDAFYSENRYEKLLLKKKEIKELQH